MAIDSTAPRLLHDMACYLDGRGFLGKVTELKLPTIEKQTVEHMGAVAKFEVDTGKFNALVASFKFAELNPDALKLPTNEGNVGLVFRGSQKDGSSNRQVTATMRGIVKKADPNAYTAGEKMDTDYEFSCRYYKLEIGNKVIYEFDLENMVAKSEGKDLLSLFRKHIGI